jgi:peptide deformylase
MAVRAIAKMGHPILYGVADPVADPTDVKIAAVARDMRDTLVDIGASAIAAPQIHENMRVVVYRLSGRLLSDPALIKEDAWTVMVNPVLMPLVGNTQMGWERCLSIPGLHGKVPRCPKLRVAYVTPEGESVEHEAEGPIAAMLQHECDHLDGILYPMRMPDLSLLEFDTTPGHLAKDVDRGEDVWPVLRELAEAWTSGSAAAN